MVCAVRSKEGVHPTRKCGHQGKGAIQAGLMLRCARPDCFKFITRLCGFSNWQSLKLSRRAWEWRVGDLFPYTHTRTAGYMSVVCTLLLLPSFCQKSVLHTPHHTLCGGPHNVINWVFCRTEFLLPFSPLEEERGERREKWDGERALYFSLLLRQILQGTDEGGRELYYSLKGHLAAFDAMLLLAFSPSLSALLQKHRERTAIVFACYCFRHKHTHVHLSVCRRSNVTYV